MSNTESTTITASSLSPELESLLSEIRNTAESAGLDIDIQVRLPARKARPREEGEEINYSGLDDLNVEVIDDIYGIPEMELVLAQLREIAGSVGRKLYEVEIKFGPDNEDEAVFIESGDAPTAH